MEKKILIIISFLLFFNVISAMNIDVGVVPISNEMITGLNKPAIFNITIKNFGENSSFEIYSLAGVDIFPKEKFQINRGESKTIEIKVFPRKYLQLQSGSFFLEYKIKNSKNEIRKDKLSIKRINLDDVFSISLGDINPNSKFVDVEIENNLNYGFKNVKLKLISIFFDYSDTFNISALEIKKIKIPLNNEKIKKIQAGSYLVNSILEISGETSEKELMIKFLEKEGIETIDKKEGFFIRRHEIIKTNVGNVRKAVVINVKKNLLSYFFTNFNIIPDTKIDGFGVIYSWEKELIPHESLDVVIKTNWVLPLILIVLVILLIILIKKYLETDFILTKKVSFVKTRGGEFALKVTLRGKAKSFIEKIHIVDKLPYLVKLYDKFGAIAPDKIDLKNRRLEWNIESLNKGEERVFSYIIYSKIGVVGKFELPSAKAVYEKEGKIKETESNRSFYINNPKD